MTNYTIAINSFMDIFTTANQMTNNLFWPLTVLIIWLFCFISLGRVNGGKGMSISFFIALLVSFLLNWAGLVENYVIGVCFAGFIITFFLNKGGEV